MGIVHAGRGRETASNSAVSGRGVEVRVGAAVVRGGEWGCRKESVVEPERVRAALVVALEEVKPGLRWRCASLTAPTEWPWHTSVSICGSALRSLWMKPISHTGVSQPGFEPAAVGAWLGGPAEVAGCAAAWRFAVDALRKDVAALRVRAALERQVEGRQVRLRGGDLEVVDLGLGVAVMSGVVGVIVLGGAKERCEVEKVVDVRSGEGRLGGSLNRGRESR